MPVPATVNPQQILQFIQNLIRPGQAQRGAQPAAAQWPLDVRNMGQFQAQQYGPAGSFRDLIAQALARIRTQRLLPGR